MAKSSSIFGWFNKNQFVFLVSFFVVITSLSGCENREVKREISRRTAALVLSEPQWQAVQFPPNFPTDVRAVWSNGPNDVWIGAYDPNCATTATVAFSHWDGASWTNSPATNLPFCPNAISGNSSGAVFAVGNGGKVASLNGTTWTVDYINSTYKPDLVALWVGSATDVWAFSRSTSQFQLNSTGWNRRYYSAAYNPLGGGAYFGGKAWGSGDCATLIACDSSTSSCGSGYGPVCSYGPFYDIWGTSSTNYWVISSNIWNYTGYIAHYTTGWWNPPPGVSSTYYNLKAIWGNSANDIWFVGGSGKMFHWDGSSVSSVASGTSANLTDIHGTASDEIWAVGNGVVRHYTAFDSAAARRRVIQECSQAMWGNWWQHNETDWPTGTTYATHPYSYEDLGAWNKLLTSYTNTYTDPVTHQVTSYPGYDVSCMRYRDQGKLPGYSTCPIAPPDNLVGYGSYEMPNYTCQGECTSLPCEGGNCATAYRRGGQCKAFSNLIAYRSGVYQLPGYGFKHFPGDPEIGYLYYDAENSANNVPRPPDDSYYPLATYSNIQPGDFLRKPFVHSIIVVRVISETQVIALDSNWLIEGNGISQEEIVGSHEFNFIIGDSHDLSEYRILKSVYVSGY